MLKTKEEIKKEIEEAVLSCPYNRKQDKEHRCSDCRTETDILEALLDYSEEIEKEINELSKSHCKCSEVHCDVCQFIEELLSKIKGKEKK